MASSGWRLAAGASAMATVERRDKGSRGDGQAEATTNVRVLCRKHGDLLSRADLSLLAWGRPDAPGRASRRPRRRGVVISRAIRARHHHRHPHGTLLVIRRGIGVLVGADDLAAVVDVERRGAGRAREVDRGEATLDALGQQEAVELRSGGIADRSSPRSARDR